MNDGYAIYLLMVVLHTMVNIGVCARLIYVIPVILHLFVVCKIEIYFFVENFLFEIRL